MKCQEINPTLPPHPDRSYDISTSSWCSVLSAMFLYAAVFHVTPEADLRLLHAWTLDRLTIPAWVFLSHFYTVRIEPMFQLLGYVDFRLCP